MKNTQKLKKLLESPEIIMAPGAYDCLSAKIIQQAGFNAVYVTGYGLSASYIGEPDVGLMSLKEMVDNVSRICDAVDIPVIADADTGYGSPLNVARTVRLYEKAGAAAIQLEDQKFPKRCGHMEGKRVIEAGEFVNKIRAAVDARHDPDFLIIARTDARAVFDLDEAIHRGQLYADAGADVIFVEAPLSVKEFQRIAESIDTPLLANMAEGAKSPMLSADELEKIGYKIVIYPVGTLFAAAYAIKQVASEIKWKGTDKGLLMKMETFSGFNELMGLKKHLEFSKKFS